MRKIKIQTDKYYHVYNRGAGKQDVFLDEKDYLRFLWKIQELNNDSTSISRDFVWRKLQEEANSTKPKPGLRYLKPGLGPYSIFEKYHHKLSQLPKLVEIICYSLLTNHYHLILKQLVDGGITTFMHKLGTSYTKYFNNKYGHSGVLFQGPFQAYPINNDGKLCHLSAYVNCNYEIHLPANRLEPQGDWQAGKLGKTEYWKFCSYKDYLRLRGGKLINKDVVLKLFNNNIKEYKKYCEIVIKESQDKKRVEKMLVG